ncbi:hypothetical protein I230019B6_27790 [Firmicutes bacterium i23-0019-B6]
MMKYLTDEYWSNINTNSKGNKGICFEDLIKDLLIAEYGKKAFQSTKYSWDGSKDFYYYSKQQSFWAECKNYSSNIDLKVLASTLIMAQLSEIDTILYYSYSPITINAKAKLLINAEKNGETVYFYDDDILEQKIFQYWEQIGEHYFPDFCKKNSLPENNFKYAAKCLLFGNPLDTEASVDKYELKHLTMFKMFEMNICIFNRENITVELSIEFKNSAQIKAQYEVYPDYIMKSQTRVHLTPYEGKNIRLWFIPIKENCTIPNPYINGKKVNLPSNITFKSLEVRYNKRLIGKNYEHSLEEFKRIVLLETNKIKIGIFYGNSGTGKSRLYQECLNSAKINGYDIIDFSSITNHTENLSEKEFIKKLLISIYDISLDVLEQILKVLTFANYNNSLLADRLEYHMLIEFLEKTDADIETWIDKYLDLILLKLSKKRLIITIDNIQFYDENIIDLLDNICMQLMNIYPCNTKFLLVFNTDYIARNSKVDLLLGKYASKKSVTYAKHVRGFENSSECYEFLQESFSIGNLFHKTEIDEISERLNKNPFYLEQMIYWLLEKGALECQQNKYVIRDSFLIKSLIQHIPNTVFNILLERWKYYCNHHKTDFEKVLTLFSAIHLYGELNTGNIEELSIPEDILNELEKLGFITLTDTYITRIITFRHDLIDDFFSKNYKQFSKQIIIYENQHNFCLKKSNLRSYFGKLYSSTTTVKLSNKQFTDMLTLHIDNKLAYEYYLTMFNKFWENFNDNYKADSFLCISNLQKIVIAIHDILGNNVAEDCVQTLMVNLQDVTDIFEYDVYGKLLLYISEAYDSMGKYKKAVDLIRNYKNKRFGINDENACTYEDKKLLSEIYNRLHVYCRHQTSAPLENQTVMNYLNKSSEIADDISYAVMQYVNYSDRGYLYYDFPLCDIDSDKTEYYWNKACKIYEKGGAEIKELNYFRKRSQLALLEGDSNKAVLAIKNGLDQIDISEYSYQQSFFKWWFYHALAEAYLLCYNPKIIAEIEKALERAHFYSELLKSNKKFYYLQLKSIYLYYIGQKQEAFTVNNEALILVEKGNYKNKKEALKKQLLQNRKIFSSTCPKPHENIYSQIHTTDGLFNMPCI